MLTDEDVHESEACINIDQGCSLNTAVSEINDSSSANQVAQKQDTVFERPHEGHTESENLGDLLINGDLEKSKIANGGNGHSIVNEFQEEKEKVVNHDNSSSCSVSPIHQGKILLSTLENTKDFKNTAFSSLTNIASKFMDSYNRESTAPTTSYSMSDLDRFSDQPYFIEKFRNPSAQDECSTISDDFDAYDLLKKEAATLDNNLIIKHLGDSGSPIANPELQSLVKKLEYDLDVANGTIKHVYEESSKRLHEVSMQYEAKISAIDKKFIECIKQKDEVTRSLDESMDARRKLQSNKENLIKSMSNQADENERLRARLRISTDELSKLKSNLDVKTSEASELNKAVKKLQCDLSTLSVKAQWAESKLKSECDAHQLTRNKLAGMDAKIREAKEEADIIRSNCQSIIDKYQNSEEIQSNALSTKLGKLESDYSDLGKKHEALLSSHESKCKEFEDVSKQMEQIKDQLFEKDADYRRVLQVSKSQEDEKIKLANDLEDLDERLNSYNELKAELKNAYENNQQLDSTIIDLREQLKLSEASNVDLNDKEKGNLEYFEKISSKNAELQLEVNSLKAKYAESQSSSAQLSSDLSDLNNRYSEISNKYSSEVNESELVVSELRSKVQELEKCKVDLECQVHDLKNDAMASKRKHQADNRDLIRQIEQFRKQFERQEESMRRSESVNSLESTEKPSNRSGGSSEAEDSASLSNESGATLSLGNAGTLLVERLCSLQKVLAKRQEKIEFYESHVNTLTRDVQRKSRIIQSLLLRVETGERTKLASEAYKKSQPSENFLGQPSNGMTLKLSMEINEKLQQVLEDTLFKNITLKENIKTLGDEIDRLNKR